MISWYRKLFGRNSAHTEVLAERLHRQLRGVHVGYIQAKLGNMADDKAGLSRQEIYDFCKYFPVDAERLIERAFERRAKMTVQKKDKLTPPSSQE